MMYLKDLIIIIIFEERHRDLLYFLNHVDLSKEGSTIESIVSIVQ
jgi:hypothetical protein